MYCKNCGQKLEEGDRFCSSCGAKTVSEGSSHITEDFGIHIGTDTGSAGAIGSQSSESKVSYEPFDFSTINFGFDLDLNANAAQAEVDAEAEEQKLKFITPVEDFDWNIHSFPGMEAKKTEDIDFNWSMPVEEEKPEPEPQSQPKSQPESALQNDAPISADTGSLAEEKPEVFEAQEPKWDSAEKSQPASSLEEELFGNLDSKTDEAKKQSEEIDKFFTFHEKNEAFQKLLDQEYEKIKSGNILADEMDTAAAASEEKFASRKPEDPMEDLFASEGIVKGYEPKPVETDVLERIEAAEAEKRAKEESARLIEEAKAKAEEEARVKEEARAKEEAEEKRKAEEEAARKRLEEEAKRAADARAAREAEEREQARAAAREGVQAALKASEEKHQKQRQELEAKIDQQAAQMQKEAEEKIRAQEEARAKEEEERRLKAEAEAKAAEEARLKAEAEAKAAEEAERIRKEAEAKAAREAAEREQAKAAAEKAAAEAAKKADEENHISEMVKARETFFGQNLQQTEEPADGETPPVKTKAVDKAAILAGMATASEMVQRDRAYAAAEAAKAAGENVKEPQEEPDPVDLSDFLGIAQEEAEAPAAEAEADSADLLEELQAVSETPAFEMPEIPEASQNDMSEDLFAIDQLLGEEEQQSEQVSEPEPFILEDITEPEPVQQPEELKQTGEVDLTVDIEDTETADSLQETPEIQEASLQSETDTGTVPADTAEFTIGETEIPDETKNSSLFPDEEEEFEEEYTGGKGRVVLKICLIILIVLLALEIAGVVIKVAMPSSGAAKFIDQKLNQVIQMVTGDDVEYSVIAATEDIRQQAMEDKTQLIQAELGKNKDGNIGEIQYNAELKFDPDHTYENTDINLTQNLADITWYKDANNKQVYYDQAIVGAIIAYSSQRVNMANYNDVSVLNLIKKDTDLYTEIKDLGKKGVKETFQTLQIGEIRQAGSQYYVWVSEKVKTSGSGTSTTDKIYEMTPEGETMKMVASYTA